MFSKKRTYPLHLLIWKKLLSTNVVWWILRKLGVKQWLAKIVKAMCRNTWSHVRVNRTFRDNVLVQVGLHQSSTLSPLSFIIVLGHYLEKLSQDVQRECFMLYSQWNTWGPDWKEDWKLGKEHLSISLCL